MFFFGTVAMRLTCTESSPQVCHGLPQLLLPDEMTESVGRQSSLNPTSPLIQFTQPLNTNFRLKRSLNNHLINKECLLELQQFSQITQATDQLISTTTELTV